MLHYVNDVCDVATKDKNVVKTSRSRGNLHSHHPFDRTWSLRLWCYSHKTAQYNSQRFKTGVLLSHVAGKKTTVTSECHSLFLYIVYEYILCHSCIHYVTCMYLLNIPSIEPDTVTCEHGLLDVFKPYYAVLYHFYTGMLKTYFIPLKTHP